MTQEPHPDLYLQRHAVKQIATGGTQFADDAAMEAMWRAIESGMGKEEAEKVFKETYKKCIDASISIHNSSL